jgi:hypothetical protein
MSDTAQVAMQTGAKVVGAPITIAKLRTQGVPEAQLVQVNGTGGELLSYPALGFNVEPILGRHGEPPAFTNAFGAACTAAIPTPTPDEAVAETTIEAKGSTDAHIVDLGPTAYGFTFDTGFRLAYRDSGGVMTDYEKAGCSATISPMSCFLLITKRRSAARWIGRPSRYSKMVSMSCPER